MRTDEDADDGGRFGPRALVLTVLACSLVARVVDANPHPSAAYVPFVLGLYVLPTWYATGHRRAAWRRHTYALLGGQAVLTYLPFVLFGSSWVGGASGLLGALALLTLRPAVGWASFAALGVIELGLWLAVGLPYHPAANASFWVVNAFVITSLSGFALNRLADLLDTLRATRAGLVAEAVARQRLAAALQLQDRVVDRLVKLSACATSAVRTQDPRRLHTELVRIGALARDAAADSRRLLLELPVTGGDAAASDESVGVAPRLARGVAVSAVVLFALQSVLNVVVPPPGSERPAGTGLISVLIASASVVLTLWHLVPRADGLRRRGWQVTLAVQAALAVLLYALTDAGTLPLWGLVVASALALVHHRARWFLLALGTVVIPVLAVVRPLADQEDLRQQVLWSVYVAAIETTVSLMIYGMGRFMSASIAVRSAQQEMAGAAATAEQLRLARDVHDTLGLGLATIALKSDLALGLEQRDPDRARHELLQVMELAVNVTRDARALGAGGVELELDAELASARSTLETAGVKVHLAVGAPARELPPVLASVLREAVTNVVRHSRASTCRIDLVSGPAGCELRIENDGVQPPRDSSGMGLQNMQDRLRPWGGRLHTERTRSDFVLTVTVPTPEMMPA